MQPKRTYDWNNSGTMIHGIGPIESAKEAMKMRVEEKTPQPVTAFGRFLEKCRWKRSPIKARLTSIPAIPTINKSLLPAFSITTADRSVTAVLTTPARIEALFRFGCGKMFQKKTSKLWSVLLQRNGSA